MDFGGVQAQIARDLIFGRGALLLAGVDRQVAVFLGDHDARMGLHGAVADEGDAVIVLHDHVRLREALLHVALDLGIRGEQVGIIGVLPEFLDVLEAGGQIAAHVLVDADGIGLHGFFDRQHRGQLLVFHMDERGRLRGCQLVVRHDERHVVADIANLLFAEDVPVAEIAAGADLRHVGAGEHAEHARQRQRLRGVDREDVGMGVRADDQPRPDRAVGSVVARVFRGARHLFQRVDADGAGSDDFQLIHVTFLPSARPPSGRPR